MTVARAGREVEPKLRVRTNPGEDSRERTASEGGRRMSATREGTTTTANSGGIISNHSAGIQIPIHTLEFILP